MANGKSWCITLHNPLPSYKSTLVADPTFVYFVENREICPETGKTHGQAYLEFSSNKRLGGLVKIFGPKNHFEPRKGTREQARDYCMKEESREPGTVPLELGEWKESKGKGKRTDLQDACESLKKRGLKPTIEESPHMYVKYAVNMERLAQFYVGQNSQFRKLNVVVLVGPPGCGKTRYVWDNNDFDEVYPLTTYGKGKTWFQGYMGQKILLIDDFNGNIEFTELLRILDGYKLYVETKGGSALAEWTTVYITSNYPVSDWYAGNYNIAALQRRINRIYSDWSDGAPVDADVPAAFPFDDVEAKVVRLLAEAREMRDGQMKTQAAPSPLTDITVAAAPPCSPK